MYLDFSPFISIPLSSSWSVLAAMVIIWQGFSKNLVFLQFGGQGATNRRGAKAAIELIRELRSCKHCGLVADGSQGPARIAQAGPLLLAGKSGGIVLPMAYSASCYITFKTWDRLILPKPFSTIDVFYGKPFMIPNEVKAGDLEDYRPKLENSLNVLYEEAWSLHGKKEH